jgi:hypothetical protein
VPPLTQAEQKLSAVPAPQAKAAAVAPAAASVTNVQHAGVDCFSCATMR